MKVRMLLGALALSVLATGANAASPKGFKAGENSDSKIVICTNKAEHVLTKAEGKWCTAGEGAYCSKNRMKAAKKACKIKK
ncbi:hypothetical protein HBA55_30720 [Pseudomaricurvus alkylphenolicus]|jgi:hypothetical protein|uniref:hypothetical protein n=1 Tax=Pseudomaricurvus alkylphenolicus TaxID=1306991 RepID=UPI00141F7D79|nr:hypothetical protein [Pseudomaricurvus alkylphenolicus]NIB44016.1 hypothetical protein [Pseudomaricurvus alkylphenolicus]